MALSATCPTCHATFRLADEMAGKKVKCRTCQNPFVIPAANDAGASKKSSSEQVAAGPGKPRPTAKKSPAAAPPMIDTSRTPRRSGRSTMTIVLIFLLGGGFFSCLGCVGALGLWWHDWINLSVKLDSLGPLAVADDKKAKDKKDAAQKAGENKDILPAEGVKGDGAKDRPPVDGTKDKNPPPVDGKKEKIPLPVDGKKDKIPPPVDGKKEKIPPPPSDGSKDGAVKEKKLELPVLPGSTNVVFGPDGMYRSAGTLADSDPLNRTKRPYKLYQVLIQADQTYQIDMESKDFAPYLFLFDDKSQTIKEDEDSGGPSHARIMYQAKSAGIYRVHASTFGKKLGKFTLTVRAKTAAAVDPKIKSPVYAPIGGSAVRAFSISPLGFEMLIRTDDRIAHAKLNKKE